MEQLLPIILALGFFAYKQYKKSIDNKQTQPVNAQSDTGFFDDSKESVEEGLNDYINKFLKSEDVDFANLNSDNDEEYDVDSDEELTLNSQTDTLEKDEYINIRKKKSTKVYENLDTELSDFDLRQAIVYDAVLNAPYIEK